MSALPRQGGPKVGTFGFNERWIGVRDFANSLGQVGAIRNSVGRGYPLLECALVLGVGVEIGMHESRSYTAQPVQAMAHVEDERFARLLTIVDHVEARFDLLLDNVAGGIASLRLEFFRVDCLAR